MVSIFRYPEGVEDEHMQGMEGKVLTGVFELDGYQFMALDGGPHFNLTRHLFLCATADRR
jgi:predicted 3-demethylubiquinone-9 3-methyltransferase (glyoxalase superfamily)